MQAVQRMGRWRRARRADTVHALLARRRAGRGSRLQRAAQHQLSGPADAIDALCAAVSHRPSPDGQPRFPLRGDGPSGTGVHRGRRRHRTKYADNPGRLHPHRRWRATESITDPGGWGEAVRSSVRYREAGARLATAGEGAVEIGPRPVCPRWAEPRFPKATCCGCLARRAATTARLPARRRRSTTTAVTTSPCPGWAQRPRRSPTRRPRAGC